MANQNSSTRENEGIAALALNGSANLLDALSELYILQEVAGRWAFSKELDLEGDEVRPSDMFDIIGGTGIGGFYAVLFVRLKMTIGQAIRSHRILERVFQSDAWKNKIQQACIETLDIASDEIVNVLDIETSLDSPFVEKNPKTKCFVCVVNPAVATSCRLLRNYRSRKDQAPRCTIRKVLHATLSNHAQLPAVCIEEELFLSALNGYANPTHMLVKELGNAYTKGAHVACLVNVGAGDLGIQALTSQTNAEELAGLLRSCQLVADDVASQCHDLGAFFFPFSVTSGLGEESCFLQNENSRVKGLTKAYLFTDEISTRLDDLEERLCERFGVVSIERLNSLAGKDGESRVAARLAKVEEHLNGSIFKDINNWLQPIHQTSKLDANIRARSGTTCQWLLKNDTFMKWMEKKRGLLWFRGLMGTGKTVMSSFMIETLRARGEAYVAFFYFEFTNPITLSEEAVLRSLVCQLAGASPAVVRTLYQKHNNGGLQPQLATLQNALNELVSASAKPVFIIIDALDELPPTQRKYFLPSLLTFSTSNIASRTHVMVTSREEVDIHRAFKEKVDSELEVQGDLVRQDIAAFVDRELAAQKWTHWPRDAIEITRRLLNERADGQFRMVACQIAFLHQVKTFEQLELSLNSLPTTLSDTYNYILEKIPKDLRNQAHLLFALLSFASEPISPRELFALLAVEFGDEEDSNQLPVLQEKNQMVDPLDVVDLGTSLISRLKGLTMGYLSLDEISTRVDDLEEKLRDRFGAVSIERLNSVAGKDGESRVAARLAKVEEHLNDTLFQDVKNWLQPIHQTSKLDANIRTRSGATCQWLLKNGTFMKWMEKKCGLFWFRGLMGTGKTVMSSFVIETLLARGDSYVAFFYFEFTNPTTLSEEAILRSLVCQLAGASPAVVRTLYQKHNNGGLQPQLSSLQDTLNQLVSVSTKPVFIIIDALDELPLVQRNYFLQSLVTFSTTNIASRTHVMITSREEVDIHRAFKEKVDFELAVQGDLVRQDIAAFVDQELAVQKWKFWPQEAIEMARRLLNEKADGQFRMVACQVDILRQVKTFEQLQRSLNSLPTTLGDTYNYILEKIPTDLREQAHLLFAILSFASRPISAHELSALLAVEFGDEEDANHLPVLQEKNQLVDPLDVVDLGTPLVSRLDDYRGTSVRLAHASVKEHLLITSNTWLSLREDLAHSMIARSCLALIVHFRILQLSDRYKYKLWHRLKGNVAALYPYSTHHWFEHVFPNGPPQLLRQQQYIYKSLPWPRLHEPNNSSYKLTKCPLVSAAYFGLFDLVEALLNSRSWETKDLTQALIAAATSERDELLSIQCCHVLITYGADVNDFTGQFVSYPGSRVLSPLEGASSKGKLEIVCFLVERDADVNASGGTYGSALTAAASCGNLEIVRFLVQKGADVNASGGEYGSALQAGASNGSLEIVCFLVKKGADVNASGRYYGSALQAGASNGSLEIVCFLVKKGADVNASGRYYGSALQAGASRGDLGIVCFLVEKGADVNASGGEYGSALQAGARSASLEIVCFLVKKGADVNASGGYYGSALQAGAYRGSLEIVRFLVEKGADANASGGFYGSALQAGADSGSLEIVRFLIENGANINTEGGHWGTTLYAAAFYEWLEIVCFLVEKGADMNASGGFYGSTLHCAASRGRLDVIHFLVQQGADVNANGRVYDSALQVGAHSGSLEIVHFLVEKGADVNAKGGIWGTPLTAAADSGSLEIVRFLVKNGANVNAIGGYPKTALDAAQDPKPFSSSNTDRDEIVQFLKSCGAKSSDEM
ncbi:hypothetical protein DL96DRAFT_1820352 [Flagelloscypha sp. PMI_526]|nr:hypothetical protein DL96DRAFT_1820352 [Flagelloscypha sp. PMI_526]